MTREAQHRFDAAERDTVYRAIALRRDTRHFKSGQVLPDAQLQRLLQAMHQAPSVGLMQPWRLLRIRNESLRAQIATVVEAERQATAAALGERSDEFLRLKVEGLRDCAELLAIVLPPDDGTVFGRRSMPREMAIASLGCAVQNLWLAARAENLGLGWVSMFEPRQLAALLRLPEGAQPLGLLCLGPVDSFYTAPMLELEDWRRRRPLDDLLMNDFWSAADGN
jgi:5,6-dimethylbenzimidazole synthase